MKTYAGVGARRSPDEIVLLMEQIGEVLAAKGWTLRSGAAEGADAAFEAGALRGAAKSVDASLRAENWPCEIFLPWPGYNGHASQLHSPSPACFRIAEEHHPNWLNLKSSVKRLMARNVQQVLGREPGTSFRSQMVICWTYQGRVTGGTGATMLLANAYHVPVWNLGIPSIRDGMAAWVRDQTDQSGYY